MRQHDDVDETITEAVERHVQVDERTLPVLHITPSSMPFAVTGPLPLKVESPPRHGRAELHITAPQESRKTPPDGLPAQTRAPLLRTADEALPIFQETGEALGWQAFDPAPQIPDITPALRSIYTYSAQSLRQLCQATEQARGELLWERAREYDKQEAEHRAKHPLNRTTRM